jgi:hypothetical protein
LFQKKFIRIKSVQQTMFFIVKSKPTAIFTVVFRGVSVQTTIGLDLSVVSCGDQESLGCKDFWSCLQPWCFRGVQESLGRKDLCGA